VGCVRGGKGGGRWTVERVEGGVSARRGGCEV